MSARRASEPPRECHVALLLIDVINDLEFVGGDKLLRHALPMAKRVAALTARAREASVPVIYANDNFGHWRSDFRAQVRHCLRDGVRGGTIAQLLHPCPTDYFVLKPKHSAFFLTALEALLHALGARTLVMAGLAGDNCVLFTAHDAYMREYRLFVPHDGIASESPTANRWALGHMKRFLKVDTREGAGIDFERLKGASSSGARAARRGVTTRRDEA